MKQIKKFIKLVVGMFLLSIIAVLAVNFYVNKQTNKVIFSNIAAVPKTKVAIIFGAGINGDKPSKYLKDRLDAGILLYKNNIVDKILLSGDNGRDEHDELTVMKLYCYENGVDTNKIYIDYAGFDSYSTMYRAKNIFKVDTAILITQKYHLNRCIYLGNKLGVKSFGFNANSGTYKGYRYYSAREHLSVFKAVLDVVRNRKPRFLGAAIAVTGASNYTKQ